MNRRPTRAPTACWRFSSRRLMVRPFASAAPRPSPRSPAGPWWSARGSETGRVSRRSWSADSQRRRHRRHRPSRNHHSPTSALDTSSADTAAATSVVLAILIMVLSLCPDGHPRCVASGRRRQTPRKHVPPLRTTRATGRRTRETTHCQTSRGVEQWGDRLARSLHHRRRGRLTATMCGAKTTGSTCEPAGDSTAWDHRNERR